MMNTIERIIISVNGWLTLPVSIGCSGLVISYLTSKSPGMQTFNDSVMIDFQHLVMVFSLCTLTPYSFGNVVSNISQDVALVIAFFIDIIELLFIIYIITLLVVKYISIYYSTVLTDLYHESLILNGLRFGLAGVAILLHVLEVNYISNPNNHNYVQILIYGDTNDDLESSKVQTTLALVFVIVMIFVQTRIELDGMVKDEHSGCIGTLKRIIQTNQINPDPNQEVPYKINVLRTGVTGLFMLATSFFVFFPLTTQFTKMVMLLVITECLYIGIPTVFIWSHDNIKKHFVKKIKSLLCINDPIINLNV
jgi:hypothetical protein